MAETVTSQRNKLYPSLTALAAAHDVPGPAPATTWAKLDGEIVACHDRCAAKVKAQTAPVVASPAVTAPAVVTAPAIADPDRAQAYKIGRGELFDRVAAITGGEGRALLKPPAYDSAPKGTRWNGTTRELLLEGPPTLSGELLLEGIDWTGVRLSHNQPFPLRLRNGRIATDPKLNVSGYGYGGPQLHPDAKLTMENLTIDQWSEIAVAGRWRLPLGLPTITDGQNLRFVNVATTSAYFGPGMKATFRDIYFEGPGQNPFYPKDRGDDGTFDHPESFHHHGGEVTIDGFFADFRTKPFFGTGMALHQWRTDSTGRPAGLALYRNGFVLMGQGQMNYAIQLAGANYFPGKTRLENIAWRQTGCSAANPGNGQVIDDQNNARLSGSGNVNFDTGEALWGRINAA